MTKPRRMTVAIVVGVIVYVIVLLATINTMPLFPGKPLIPIVMGLLAGKVTYDRLR